jgi:uncharacterized protein YbcC (UPF0753/DUF2309 family)
MSTRTAELPREGSAAADPGDVEVERIVRHAAHLLPAQGPIGVFVHHNTLHAFQHLPFHRAVREAADLHGARPYLKESVFREELRRGRILPEDVEEVLAREADAEILPGRLSRRRLRRLLLVPGVRPSDPATLRWRIEEGGWVDGFREDLPPEARHALAHDDAKTLWAACLERVSGDGEESVAAGAVGGAEDDRWDEVVHPLLIRLCGAFLDQGISYWPMPGREAGLFLAARNLLLAGPVPYPLGLERLGDVLREQVRRGRGAVEVVRAELEGRGLVGEPEREAFVRDRLLALPGWAGLVHKLEVEPELAPHDRVPCAVMDFLALRLSLEAAARAGNTERRVAAPDPAPARWGAAAALFEVAQLAGLDSGTVRGWDDVTWGRLRAEIRACDDVERRRIFQEAYERRHERQILLPLRRHRQRGAVDGPSGGGAVAQVFFCIDEREESLRRHLEEVDPEIETFGAAGFFGVAMNYQGLDDPHGVSLCPVVVKPGHAVVERPVEEHAFRSGVRRVLRRVWAAVAWNGLISTRTLVRGWISTATLGFLSIFPLAARILTPLGYARLMRGLNRLFLPEPRTEMTFMREDAEGREATEGLMRGFTVREKVERVAGVLGAAGLREEMARLVVVLGHGSNSLNNPYQSAYCCGACGGYHGGPNARLFAAMANHPAVRAGLREQGFLIPEDGWFLGGYHDTCNDAVRFFDEERVPAGLRGDVARVKASLDQARARSALERCRRFEVASWKFGPEAGLRHVEERAEHLGEPRPEYGHSTNAVAFVGRRRTTRGLFLDRRAFLVSYDAAQDPRDEALARVLGAVIPVCGGISLEYYFSTVDNEVYGSGTKLPHNITGLVGVMNGYQGDLRTGLPLQTVEIHEPVRILFVVETTPERLMPVIRANPELAEFVENRWIRLSTMDPDTGEVRIYREGGGFEPLGEGEDEGLPEAPTSAAWYAGRRGHLPLARIAG